MKKYKVGDIMHFPAHSPIEEQQYWMILKIGNKMVDIISIHDPDIKDTVFRWDTTSGYVLWNSATVLNKEKKES